MNIYQKLQTMRVALQSMNIKKSGKNTFVKYEYYELGDILPTINKLMMDNGVASIVSFEPEAATLTLINCDDPNETVKFVSPMAGVTLKGAHDIQNLGAVETYQRRYLYMMAFEVVESDYFDATQGKPKQEPKKQPPKRKNKLSEDMSHRLNEALSEFAGMTNQSVKQVLGRVQQEVGKSAAEMDEQDGQRALNILANWKDKALQELGA